MNSVAAEIDVTNETYSEFVQDVSGTWHDFTDVNNRALDKMSEHYGVDMRPLVAKFSKYKTWEV